MRSSLNDVVIISYDPDNAVPYSNIRIPMAGAVNDVVAQIVASEYDDGPALADAILTLPGTKVVVPLVVRGGFLIIAMDPAEVARLVDEVRYSGVAQEVDSDPFGGQLCKDLVLEYLVLGVSGNGRWGPFLRGPLTLMCGDSSGAVWVELDPEREQGRGEGRPPKGFWDRSKKYRAGDVVLAVDPRDGITKMYGAVCDIAAGGPSPAEAVQAAPEKQKDAADKSETAATGVELAAPGAGPASTG
jgi:hypothetical protein